MLFLNSERLNQVVFGVMYDIRYIQLMDCNKNKYLHRKQKLSNFKSLVEICTPKKYKTITVTLFRALYILRFSILCSSTRYSYSILVYIHKIYLTHYSVSHIKCFPHKKLNFLSPTKVPISIMSNFPAYNFLGKKFLCFRSPFSSDFYTKMSNLIHLKMLHNHYSS